MRRGFILPQALFNQSHGESLRRLPSAKKLRKYMIIFDQWKEEWFYHMAYFSQWKQVSYNNMTFFIQWEEDSCCLMASSTNLMRDHATTWPNPTHKTSYKTCTTWPYPNHVDEQLFSHPMTRLILVVKRTTYDHVIFIQLIKRGTKKSRGLNQPMKGRQVPVMFVRSIRSQVHPAGQPQLAASLDVHLLGSWYLGPGNIICC